MAYQLSLERPLRDDLIELARQEIGKAIHAIEHADHDQDKAVHDVRRQCKLLRAALRLVRLSFPGYRAENVWFRDIARSLSLTRDAAATIEAFDATIARFDQIIHPDALTPIRTTLAERRDELTTHNRLPFLLGAALRDLKVAYRRCGDWQLDSEGFEAIAGGLRKTYRRGRRRMQDSRRESSTFNLHEWRKRTKYHRYHLKLLRGIWPTVLTVLEKEAHTLTDYLGDDHDLSVLRATLLDEPERFGKPQVFRPFLGLINWRRAELQKAAFPQGLRLYSMAPARRIDWFSDLWTARMAERTPRPPARSFHRPEGRPVSSLERHTG